MPTTFERPPAALLDSLLRALAVPIGLTSPVVRGLENVPDDRPLLFVGNHVVWSGLDPLALFKILYEEKGIFLRSLGDHLHFEVPLWRDFLRSLGVVDGTRENCSALMDAGECILVFPGGAREVAKRRGEAYQLFWGERLGFARLAIAHGCTIVPYAVVGGEEMLDIVFDANDANETVIGAFVDAFGLRKDAMLPIVTGLGPTPIPRPERLYFQFEPPIRVEAYGREASDANAREVRDRAKAAVEKAIAELRGVQASDPDRAFSRRAAKLLPSKERVSGFARMFEGGLLAARAVVDVALRGVSDDGT